MPRRQHLDCLWGLCPWCGISPTDPLGKVCREGAAQLVKALLRRGTATASHQAAKPNVIWPLTFKAKLIFLVTAEIEAAFGIMMIDFALYSQ